MILALAQRLPTQPRRVIRTSAFADFQHLCGLLERESYRAGHAACHASMNGFSRVLAANADIEDQNSVKAALHALFEAGPFDALAFCAPLKADTLELVLDICAQKANDFDFLLFLDPERGEAVEDIIENQKALPTFARYAYPWVKTLSPGRRSYECLPPSCFAPALCLGLSHKLKGVHELDELSPNDAADLADAGIAVMHSPDLRTGIILLQDSKKQADEILDTKENFSTPFMAGLSNRLEDGMDMLDPSESAIQARLLEAIDQKCADVLRQSTTNGPLLWSSLKRSAISVLRDAQSRGSLKAYHVRCDEETASWGDENSPVIEILLSFEKRVKELRFSVGRINR